MSETITKADRTAEHVHARIGYRAFVMLGAYQFVALADGLKFRIRGCGHGNLIMVKVIHDLYEVSLWSLRGANARQVDRSCGVYVAQLHETIEKMTGLRTSLGTMKGA